MVEGGLGSGRRVILGILGVTFLLAKGRASGAGRRGKLRTASCRYEGGAEGLIPPRKPRKGKFQGG